MSRLDRLPENKFATELKQQEDELRNSKLNQRTSTRSGVQVYLVQTTNTWDYSDTLSATSGTKVASHTFTYTPANSNQNYFARIITTVYIGAQDSAHLLDTYTQLVSPGPYWAHMDNYALDMNQLCVNNQYTFHMDISFSGTFQYWVKTYFVSTCEGNISMTRTIA